MKSLSDFVISDKDIVGGKPVFKGTRVTVQTLFDYLEDSSLDDFLIGHPTVTKEQAEAVLSKPFEQKVVTVKSK